LVDFNANFGYNIRNYQQMQKMKFGNGIRAGFNPQSTMYSMNASLFKLPDNVANSNIFKNTNPNQNFSFNGVNYDNAYAMLNNVGEGADKSGGIDFGKLKDGALKLAGKIGDFLDNGFDKIGETFNKVADTVGNALGKAGKAIGDTATKAFNGVKNGINKLFGKKDGAKADGVGKALDDIKNAQDKETLNKALDGAKVEQQSNAQQANMAEKAEKAADKGKADADKKADSADKKLDNDKKQLENDKGALEQAKSDVTTAKSTLEAATQGVASAQQALDTAKAAATSENPNTAAISNAESQLRLAQEKETQAKNDLAAKEQALDAAQKKVDAQAETVKGSEQESKQAQDGVKQAEAEVKSAQQKSETVKAEGEQINAGVVEGEQKLEQMGGDDTQASQTSVAEDDTGFQPGKNMYDTQRDMIETGGYTDVQKQNMKNSMDQIMNMQPGDTIQIGDTVYNMDDIGVVYSSDNGANVSVHPNAHFAATSECNHQMNMIKADREAAMEEKLLGFEEHKFEKGSDEYDETMFEHQDERIKEGGYTSEQKAEVNNARNKFKNMQPGQAFQCGGNTYSMDENGIISVNGEPHFESRDYAARYASENLMSGYDAKNKIANHKKELANRG